MCPEFSLGKNLDISGGKSGTVGRQCRSERRGGGCRHVRREWPDTPATVGARIAGRSQWRLDLSRGLRRRGLGSLALDCWPRRHCDRGDATVTEDTTAAVGARIAG